MSEDLTDAQRAELREDLLHLRETLTEALAAGKSRQGTVHLDQTAVGRVSRIDAIQQQKMAQAEARRREVRLEQVARALAAFDDGDYGDCARCGDPIGYRRLKARPESPFCVPCATQLGA